MDHYSDSNRLLWTSSNEIWTKNGPKTGFILIFQNQIP